MTLDRERKSLFYLFSLLEDTSIAIGIAIYNPERDRDYLSVFSRADAAMYDNKRVTKAKNSFFCFDI